MDELQLALPLDVASSPVTYKPKFPSYDPYWDEILKTDNPVLTVEYIEEISTVSTHSPEIEEPVLTVEDVSNCDHDDVSLSTVSTKRGKGEGTGRIQWRTVNKKNGRSYKQAWYDWQIHCENGKTISRSRYISARLLSRVLELESQKASVTRILELLGVRT